MKKIGFKSIGIFAVFALSMALSSCGGSSGGGETEINFEKDDLVGKYWFANDFVSDDFNQDDDVIVYYFERSGDLIKQEYGGREEREVGVWSLDKKKLVIKDKTFGNGESIDWFLQKGTNSDNLVLSADNRRKLNCSTSFSELNDVTADAFVVSSINLAGDVSRYMQCRVTGRDIKDAKLLLDPNVRLALTRVIEGTESVFVLGEDGINEIKSEIFPESDDAKFYLNLDKNIEVKLSDINDNKSIVSLKNEIDYNQGTHLVKWNAVDENDIYYYVEILDSEGKIVFRSGSLPAVANQEMEIKINRSVDSVFESLEELDASEQCKVRITGVKYEDEIKPSTSKYEDYNVQAKTVFSYPIIWS